MSYQYSNFPDQYDFQDWEHFENIDNTDKDNIIADREYLVDDNKRLSAQFVNIVLDSIRAIEHYVLNLSKKNPNVTNAEGVLPISHGGTGAITAATALQNLGLTATAKELNYTHGVRESIQSQLDTKLNKFGVSDSLTYTDDFTISTVNGFVVNCQETETLRVSDDIVSVSGDINIAGKITNGDLNNKLLSKADKKHVHDNVTQDAAGFMSASDKKKLDSIAENAGNNMEKYVLKNSSGALQITGYDDIWMSANQSFYVEVGSNEVINVSDKQVQIGTKLQLNNDLITNGQIEAKELRIRDVDTSNNKIVYTIHTDVSSGTGDRLDFFKIIGGDSLVKMTFTPNISSTGQTSANGLIEIEGDVDIDSGNKLSVRHIYSDDSLSVNSTQNFVVNASHNISLRQPNSNTPDGNGAELCIKGSNGANIKGGTLIFSRNSQDILRIGEEDDTDGLPVYNQFRFEGNEFKVITNLNEVITMNDKTIKIADGSGECKIELVNNRVYVTPLYFSQLGFDMADTEPETETYLKGNSLQKITYDMLARLDALESGSSGGGGNCNCEAITEAELNDMFEEIGL